MMQRGRGVKSIDIGNIYGCSLFNYGQLHYRNTVMATVSISTAKTTTIFFWVTTKQDIAPLNYLTYKFRNFKLSNITHVNITYKWEIISTCANSPLFFKYGTGLPMPHKTWLNVYLLSCVLMNCQSNVFQLRNNFISCWKLFLHKKRDKCRF